MKNIPLLPADSYVVINKTFLTEEDKKNLINLYEPIIGSNAISLYLTLYSDLENYEQSSREFNHHHLMILLKIKLEDIKEARKALEALGLLKTYVKKNDNINNYIYELYSPLSAYDFFNHPIYNVVLYNNIGENEYNYLLKKYKKLNLNYSSFENITHTINETFKVTVGLTFNNENIKRKETNKTMIDEIIDFDLLLSSLPSKILNEKNLTKKTKEFLLQLAYIYNLDTLKLCEIIRMCIDTNGLINKSALIKETRKYYEYNNSGNLPTLIYRTQPDYLKTPEGSTSNKAKMIYIFENTTPYDFLKSKYKNGVPTSRDLKILEYLAIELNMTPAVINVLIDYVLKINDNKLTKAFIETIAGQWSRQGIKTAKDAMNAAEKEYKKKPKKEKIETKKLPVWFNNENKKEEITKEEEEELASLLKEFK